VIIFALVDIGPAARIPTIGGDQRSLCLTTMNLGLD
jgi:hypothetical protein